MTVFLFLLATLLFSPEISGASGHIYAVATVPAPVLNRPDFDTVFGSRNGTSIQKDNCGQIRALEFIAFPGTVFTVQGSVRNGSQIIYRVTTADYPYPSSSGYFVDERSVQRVVAKPAERVKHLPTAGEIITTMKSRVGSRYVWGGNVGDGIKAMPEWYPTTAVRVQDEKLLRLEGLDCSGLLYEATGGSTPRNTSSLVKYGTGIPIAGRQAVEIARRAQPLDLIAWPGHVMIVIDDSNVIESRLVCSRPEEGVRIRPLAEALTEIMKTRRPVDAISKGTGEFVLRRWYLQGTQD